VPALGTLRTVVEEGEKWRPRSLPSPLEEARANWRDPRTGEMRFRNFSNMLWGYVLAWGLFGMAALFLNRSILTDSDPMAPSEVVAYAAGIFLASTGALCVLARPFVTLRGETLTVRNPLRVYRCDFAAVGSLTSGFWGFPKLVVAGRGIRVIGMEETNLQLMRGGSDDMAVLQAEIADRNPDHPHAGTGLHARWALLDRGLVLLLLAWALYALSFYVP
jgi:hypothetical protein